MQISDAQWRVMNVVWNLQPVEARAVVDHLAAENDWSPATIKTMLHRLVKKGAISHETDGKRYRYRAAVRRSDCIRRASRSFVNRVFGGDAVPALLHLVKAAKLSPRDLEQLRAILDKKEPKK